MFSSSPRSRICASRGVPISFEDELIELLFGNGRVSQLKFARQTVDLGENDAVILAVPPYVATNFVPALTAPSSFRGIVKRAFPHRSAVRSAADAWRHQRNLRMDISAAGTDIGHDQRRWPVCSICRERNLPRSSGTILPRSPGFPSTLPPWQIVRERRATFAATPEQNARRPTAETAWNNLFLAGDWTANRPAGDDRRCGSFRLSGRGSCRASFASSRMTGVANELRLSSAGVRDRALQSTARRARCCKCQQKRRTLGFRARGRRDDSRPNTCLLRHYRGEPRDTQLGAENRRLPAAHPGKAWRLAALSRWRLRHEREREGLFRAQDDRRQSGCSAYAPGARSDPCARRRGAL